MTISLLHKVGGFAAALALALALALPVLWSPHLAVAAEGAANAADVAAGKALTFDRKKGNCLACHALSGGTQTGNAGPALKDMKTRFPDSEFLYDRIYDEQKYNPMTVMPTYGKNHALSEAEIRQIVAYLLSL
ncbi:MAG: sulfur oxidation c-type cytochrome SoxX [Nevskiaceae bacterium]|nr:MAG: sulfur oxidation c-type cytochrome SoxX [Nevskiaceae bacterium]TBR73036.1 MAG: sulfur oxidation c-type cytochrome SoxX [Nevskiaceae bacterium]